MRVTEVGYRMLRVSAHSWTVQVESGDDVQDAINEAHKQCERALRKRQ